jgi:hypothetical protein
MVVAVAGDQHEADRKAAIARQRQRNGALVEAAKVSRVATSSMRGATIGVVGSTKASRSLSRASRARTSAARSRAIAT